MFNYRLPYFKSHVGYFFLLVSSILLITSLAQAQTFQNNNVACEEKTVAGGYQVNGPWFNTLNPYIPNQIVCGRFNDDTDLGAANFSDCVVLRDVEPFAFDGMGLTGNPASLSFLQNSGKHGNNCLNNGGESQFLDAASLRNVGFAGDVSDSFYLGSLSEGNLDNDPQGFLDIAWLNLNGSFTDPTVNTHSIQYLFSQDSGGFAGPDFTPQNAFFENPDISDYTGFPSYFAGPFNFKIGNKNQLSADKSMVLMDCNEDGLDDVVTLAREDESLDPGMDDDLNLMVSINNNGVLQPVSTNNNLTVLNDAIGHVPMNNNLFGAVLTSGDYNKDGHLDVIAVTNHILFTNKAPLENFAVLCQGDGACGFNCTTGDNSNIKSLNFAEPASHSIVSGDFDGDGWLDLVISDTRNQSIHYLFNQGKSLKDWVVQSVTPVGLQFQAFPAPTYLTKGRFTTTAIQKGIDEIVVPFIDANVVEYGEIAPQTIQFKPKILLYPTDGQGGILPYEAMLLNLPKLIDPTGITTADFDHCGGDDFVVLAWQDEGQGIVVTSRASLFLNENEAPDLQTASGDAAGLVNQALSFTADCSDPTFDDRNFTWKVIKSPVGSKPNFDKSSGTLIGKDNTAITASFTGDMPGDYEIELTCEDFCGLSLTKNFKILLSEEVPPTTGTDTTTSGDSTGGGTGSVVAISQGGCAASLNGLNSTGSSWTFFHIFSSLLLSLFLRRKGNASSIN